MEDKLQALIQAAEEAEKTRVETTHVEETQVTCDLDDDECIACGS